MPGCASSPARETVVCRLVTGAFGSPNCRAAEKVVRLRAAFGPDLRVRAAYGDTSGDTEMLAIAEEPYFKVFSGKP